MRGKWIKVIPLEGFTEDRFTFEYDGEPIVVFKTEQGFFALLDECSHDDARLSGGVLVEPCQVQCPKHKALFDLKSGKNLSPPAFSPLKTFPVKIEGEYLWVLVDG